MLVQSFKETSCYQHQASLLQALINCPVRITFDAVNIAIQ